MKKQLSLTQIQDTLQRSKNYLEVKLELENLNNLCEKIENNKLLEFIPIKIIACFEAFFRGIYKEIIDTPKYRKRLKEVISLKNINFDFDILGAFQDNEISLGDYISHIIPCSKLEDINSNISNLLNIKFIDEIKNKNNISSELLDSINNTFNLRHILCHEVPLLEDFNINKATQYIKDACLFIEYSNEIIENILYPNSSITTLDMIEESKKNLDILEKELDELILEIRNKNIEGHLNSNKLGFVNKWKEYREERAKSEAEYCKDGSIYPVIYINSLENTTINFIKELKNEYKYLLRK